MDLERFGRIVHERRIELGLTQEDVAARGGPTDTTMGKIENAEWKPGNRKVTLRKLDAGLDWKPGSAQRALTGGQPAPAGAPHPSTPDRVDELDVGDGSTAGIVDQARIAWSSLIDLADAHGDPEATFHAVLGSSDFYIDALLTLQAGPAAKPLLREIFNKVDEVIQAANEGKAHDVDSAETTRASGKTHKDEEAKLSGDAERKDVALTVDEVAPPVEDVGVDRQDGQALGQ